MNYQEYVTALLSWVKENSINLNDIHVSHGGSCMMLGLKLNTQDIDLTVSQEIFNRFDNLEGLEKKELGDGRYLIQVTENIDIHLSEPDFEPDCLVQDKDTGIWYRSSERTLHDYKKLNREKDQRWIELLEKLIEEETNGPDQA